jgi:hypothetical protein
VLAMEDDSVDEEISNIEMGRRRLSAGNEG